MKLTELENLEKWVKSIDSRLDNHLVHTATDIAQIKADLSWVKQFFWLLAGTSLSAVIGLIISLILK